MFAITCLWILKKLYFRDATIGTYSFKATNYYQAVVTKQLNKISSRISPYLTLLEFIPISFDLLFILKK